jgi:hypothetical protein
MAEALNKISLLGQSELLNKKFTESELDAIKKTDPSKTKTPLPNKNRKDMMFID